ncbi:putative transcriptional regulatory protein [Cladobotryum mycophilum]|uniref:Transcriptional regulatory protein n=1 Tax=Cladobotryum mycophilum TaxID=491253 RepID=A0ABR0SMM5_9HYPO
MQCNGPLGSRTVPTRRRSSASALSGSSPARVDDSSEVADAGPDLQPIVPQDQGLNPFTSIPTRGWSSTAAPASTGQDYQPISPSESRISAVEATGSRSDRAPDSAAPRSASPAIGRESHARMLLNLRGERVYIGGAASLSFLQFVRETVAAQIGPSQFSHNDKSDSMLETEPATGRSNSLELSECSIDMNCSLEYARIFQAATAGFLDIFSPTEIEGLLTQARADDTGSMNPCQKATADLIVAIGAQCKSPIDAQQTGQPYFRQAQRSAFSGMLEDPNIHMVRAFLLMAFYMLGQCRRNTAFMYLGIAVRAAVALGMHSRESYTDMKSLVHQTRLQVWMSLCILDMLVCSLLGRPPATACLRSELENSLIDLSHDWKTHQQDSVACLFASYKILSIINESIDMLYVKKVASIALVEQFLNRIEDWSRNLPDFLRGPSGTLRGSAPEKATLGSIHVSCLYYFAVTLVTRPVLISALTSQTVAGTVSPSPLASACLDAAVYLAQTCADAHKAGLLLGNMCLMKALVFAAGLILGFDMFAKREMDYESPQAAHYSEILTLLSNAILEQRKKLAARRRSRYVGRIFTLNGGKGSDEGDMANGSMIQQPILQTNNAGLLVGETSGAWFTGEQPDMDSDALRGWDSLDLCQWDSFPFNSPRVFDTE